jgi:hypothetical protein
MKRLKQLLTIAGLSAALMFATPVGAMQIPDYDRMSGRDQTDFINFLVDGSYKILSSEGKTNQAQKLLKLFTDKGKKGGFAQLEKNLAIIRQGNDKNAQDPEHKDAPFDVEAVMALTMDNNGISVMTKIVREIGKGFKPGQK